MQSSDLMISVSGVRGIVGQSLTPELLVRLGHAFGTYLHGGTVVVGRDTRVSGEMAKHAVLSGLLASGCAILDMGVCATPTLTLMVEHKPVAGGVMVTASHNPIEWNALKFFRHDGMYLNGDESRDLLNIYYSGQFNSATWDQLKSVDRLEHAEVLHVERVLSILDRNLIRSKNFRVALDCCNGAGGSISKMLLAELGCTIEAINCKPDGLFPHKPEPLAVNLQQLCAFVKESGANIGFAADPDADRVVVVDENGIFLGEELALALSLKHALRSYSSGKVVINNSTSRTTEDVAVAAGFEVVRSPAGEAHVAEKMRELNAIFGGEGNGGVMDPRIHHGRDAIVGMGLMLESMARSGEPISALAAALPQYHIEKTKIELPPAQSRALIRQLRSSVKCDRVNIQDGLRLDWQDRWVQLRASNTEPIMRIIAEAPSKAEAQSLIDEYIERIRKLQGNVTDRKPLNHSAA